MASLARDWDSIEQETHRTWDAEGALVGSSADHEDWASACPQPSETAEVAVEQQASMIFSGFEEAVVVRNLEEQVTTLMAQLESAIEMIRLAVSQTTAQEFSKTWPGYLLSLLINGPLASDQAIRAMRLWETLRAIAPSLNPPHAAALDDGTFSMAWDNGPHHLEVELHPDGSFDWFYLNKSTDDLIGEEDLSVGFISPQIKELLQKLV